MNEEKKITNAVIIIFLVLVGIFYTHTANKEMGIKPTENNKEFIGQITNLHVSSKYSELCGFGVENQCPEFSFVNAELPTKFKDRTKYADMSILVDKITIGKIHSKDIAVVPYSWSWASSGGGIYIVQDKETPNIIARIDMQKEQDYKIKIESNKITISVAKPHFNHTKPYSLVCTLKKEDIDNESVECRKAQD